MAGASASLYAGRVAEIGPVRQVIAAPHHPYTIGLMGSTPSAVEVGEALRQIPGAMPRLDAMPTGCAFHPRCPKASPRCAQAAPPVFDTESGVAACWLMEAAA